MSPRRQGYLFLGEHLDARADGVDAAVVRGVELKDGVAQLGAEGLAGQGHDCSGLAAPRRAREKQVRHVAVDGDDAETVEDIFVADDVVERLGSIFFYPGKLIGVRKGLGG